MDLELSNLLLYKNQQVINQFRHYYPEFSASEAQQLFADLLAWMWLSKQRSVQGKKTYLFGPLLILDELWHHFILHTRDYVDFSLHYFGSYFHHDAEPVGYEHELTELELTDFLQDCCIFLDEQWVVRRFSDILNDPRISSRA